MRVLAVLGLVFLMMVMVAPSASAGFCVDLREKPCVVGMPTYCQGYPSFLGLIVNDEVVFCTWSTGLGVNSEPPPFPNPPRFCLDTMLPVDPFPDVWCGLGVGVLEECINGNGIVRLVYYDQEVFCVRA